MSSFNAKDQASHISKKILALIRWKKKLIINLKSIYKRTKD